MRIKIEPKAFFMYAVFLAFSKEHPHPEDEAIKAYLDAHELIPKAQGTDTFEDQDFDVMYFGGCYLGKHLEVIRDMQRQVVEHQLLTVDIERIPYSQNIRTHFPTEGYVPIIAHASACFPPHCHSYSASIGTTKAEGKRQWIGNNSWHISRGQSIKNCCCATNIW